LNGWSINLDKINHSQFFNSVELPTIPLFYLNESIPVLEIVFFSKWVDRWVHGVHSHFVRYLPSKHIQATFGDLAWIRGRIQRHGPLIIKECVEELEQEMIPIS
jgi:hypothetical protein